MGGVVVGVGGSNNSKDMTSSPFVQTTHSHPAFNPQKLGTKGFAVIISFISCELFVIKNI